MYDVETHLSDILVASIILIGQKITSNTSWKPFCVFHTHRKSIIALTYCLCCVLHLHCSRRHTYGTENQ
jgi:hypothetical protein